jgi:hypothetical protein
MRTEKRLSELERELGKSVFSKRESVGSDLRLFYGDPKTDSPSTYETYLKNFYGLVFGETPINENHTITEFLESAEAEMVRNAAEWGNQGYIERPVSVQRRFYPHDVLIVVKDQGNGFDYESVINRDEQAIIDQGIENPQFVTERRPSKNHPNPLKKFGYQLLEKISRKQISPDGGMGFQRFIIDNQGEFNFDGNGNTMYYHLPLPENLELTPENFKRMDDVKFSS